MRKCNVCALEARSEKDLDNFVSSADSLFGKRNLCKSCQYWKNHKYNQENIKKVRGWKTNHQVRKRYGVDVATYEARMASSSVCQICDATQPLVYDHDHTTMKFRGVLCRQCNAGLGSLGDTIKGVQKALQYLIEAETH